MGVYVENKLRRLKPVCYWKLKCSSWLWLSLGVGLAGIVATGCAGVAAAPGPTGAQRKAQGAVLGSYEVIRYNAEGRADPALNPTLALRLEGGALVISVRDSELTTNVLLDVRYDAARVHPVATRFYGLLGDDSQVLSAAFMEQAAGLAGIGECAIGAFTPRPLSGNFATITFAPGTLRTASAMGDVYRQPTGVGYLIEPQQLDPGLHNLVVSNPGAGIVRVRWHNAWMRADGNQDGLCNISDLTPLGVYFGQVITTANFKCVPSDYSNDGIINCADLVPFSIHFGERCDQYLIEASDNTEGAARSYIATQSHYDSTAKAGAPVYPDLKTIYRSWQIDFTLGGQYDLAQLVAVDSAGNFDGLVRVYITPGEILPPDSVGYEAYIEFAVPGPGNYATVTGFDILAKGASGGTGALGDEFADGGLATVVANQDLILQLNAVSGDWFGEPYAAGALPADMTQADYDAIHATVAENLAWAITNNDDPQFRYLGFWFVPDAPYGGTGDPGAGPVFPDDDPRLDAVDPEGRCEITLNAGFLASGAPGLWLEVPGTVLRSVRFDVTADPSAPLNEGYYSEPELLNKLHSLDCGPGVTTNVYCNVLNWGATGATLPANGPDWQVWMCNVWPNGEVSLLTTIVWDTQADGDPEPGEFSFFHATAPLDKDVFVAEIPGIWLAPGNYIILRIFDGATWSSLNKPFDLLDCVPPG